jgi:single-strand DNA-binding protein
VKIMSVNKVILVGRLGADPEKLVTGSGKTVTKFNVATSESWRDGGGQKQEKTEWHKIIVWGAQAETCAQYLGKGRQVYLEGRLQTRQWDDKEGNKRYTTEVVAQRVQFLGSKSDGAKSTDFAAPADTNATPSFDMDAGPDDVPF